MIKLRNLMGLAGVADNENSTARQWGHRFELLMVIIAIWLPLQWHLQIHHQISHIQAQIANWVVWAVFVTETTLLFLLVHQRLHYLKHNWMNLVIILVGLPFIWQQTPLVGILRGLQLLLMLRLMLPWWNTSVHFLSRNRLGTTLLAAFVTTTLAGVLMTITTSLS